MCNHIDYPCCGCDSDLDASDELCPDCGEPVNYCVCGEDDGDGDYDRDEPDESMDGDFDTGMASAGFGTDEDYDHYETPFGEDLDGGWGDD